MQSTEGLHRVGPVNVWSKGCKALLIPESHFAGVEVVEWAIGPGRPDPLHLRARVIVTLFGENWLFWTRL